jgi:drug/metabolite transporter (DMT)-like permease
MFATLPIAAKFVYRTVPALPPPGLVLLRVVGAVAVLAAVATARGWRPLHDRRDLARFAAFSILGIAVNQLLFVGGLKYTTAIDAQVIGTSIPVFTVGAAALLGRERLSWSRVAGIALALGGTIFLIGPDRMHLSPETTLGNAMIATNALSYALYLVLSKPLLERYDALTAITWTFVFGTIFVAPFGVSALAGPQAPDALPGAVWFAVAFIVLVPTVGAYALNTWALGRVRAGTVAVYIYMQPVLTGLLAIGLLGETPGDRLVPSAAMIFAGVGLAALRIEPLRPASSREGRS